MKPTTEEFAEAKQSASEWAKERLADPQTVILDLETTGILSRDPKTEIMQVALVNGSGKSLLTMLVKPMDPCPEFVSDIHKIRNEDVRDCPTFPQIAGLLSFLLEDKHLVAYNADFDIKLLWHLFRKYELPTPKVGQTSCCMDQYNLWKGEWNEKKNGYKWQKLPKLASGEAHDALVDCMSTIKVMELMAGIHDPTKTTAEEIDLGF